MKNFIVNAAKTVKNTVVQGIETVTTVGKKVLGSLKNWGWNGLKKLVKQLAAIWLAYWVYVIAISAVYAFISPMLALILHQAVMICLLVWVIYRYGRTMFQAFDTFVTWIGCF